ncbi:MAG TPA: hypothetical protein VFE06_01920 [Acidobacteriaceae bacterium]|jgi:hypothetical protein|nr:hypothetical protein [Acidobacteriaceae bacterium]
MRITSGFMFATAASLFAASALVAQNPANAAATVSANWNRTERVSVTVPTTQILAHKLTLRGQPTHGPEFKALRDLKTDDTRLQLWFSVTRQAVLEIKPPTATQTFWDFQYADPLMEDFYANTTGKRHINMGTIPRWMFNVPPKDVPEDPAASFYPYTDGTDGKLLKDPSGRQFAEYQARIYQWYTQGGFTDELGKYHKSGFHYKIEYWDVLNEPDFENHINVEQFTRIYDAVTAAIHRIDPHVQFFSPEVSGSEVPWAKYFLNGKNHAPGSLPIAWFTFHNYVDATNDPSTWQAKYFTDPANGPTDGAPAKALVERIEEVLRIRDELSPKTRVIVDEMGTFNDVKKGEEACRANEPYNVYNPLYWNAEGANWAYIFIYSERLGLPLQSMSQMDGYRTQCPSISMFDYETNRPNAHYYALYLISHNFGPGDKLVPTQSSSSDIEAQASITSSGRKILLVNTSDKSVPVTLGDAYKGNGLRAQVVDEQSGEQPPRVEQLHGSQITLAPFAVAVVSPAAQ